MKFTHWIFYTTFIGFFTFVGCAPVPTKPQSTIDQTREVKFDKRLLQDCNKVSALVSAREEDVNAWITQFLTYYDECATYKAKENAEIKKALNIK